MTRELYGVQLFAEDQRHVLNAYPYRMTTESVKRWPDAAQTMNRGGYKLPLITDSEWLRCTTFSVRKDGRLDRRVNRCTTTRRST